MNNTNWGMRVTCGGSIIVASITKNIKSRPHQRSRAKAKATRVMEQTLPIIARLVIKVVLYR